ncbi:MAG TPA: DUF4388 domain-containing protein [Planctomycetota bacterium]|jgi:uncharacterized protein YjgD (DUF1641 family)
MGLKGNLATINLAHVFQALNNGSSTGLLRIQAPEGPRFVELKNGAISIAGRSAGRVMLGDLLISRGLIDEGKLDSALQMQKESGKMLGEVLLSTGAVTIEQLENALRFQVEEEVCELFTLRSGEFDFLENAGLDARLAPAGGLVRLNLNLAQLLDEATRRAEEWKIIEQRIPRQSMLFQTGAAGDSILQGGEGVSAEGMILLRLVKTQRTIEAMVQKGCLGRFTTNRMLLELWDAGLVEPAALSTYEKAVHAHLALNRFDEAQRLAEFLSEFGDADQKNRGRSLLVEISKARKPTAPTSSAYVKADPKVRSEVIRRSQPGLILKKEQSSWPLVVVCLVVLAGAGAGIWWFYLRNSARHDDPSVSRKQLEELAMQAQQYIVDKHYREGLQILREFRTFDSEVQKQANSLFDQRQKDVEAELKTAITTLDDAFRAGNADEIEKNVAALEPLLEIELLNQDLAKYRAEAKLKVRAHRDRQRINQFDGRIAEAEAAEKSGAGDSVLKTYEDLLAQTPPEAAAARIRDGLCRLRSAKAEALAAAKRAQVYREGADSDAAKASLEKVKQCYPKSSVAEDAEKMLAELGTQINNAQTEFDRIQALVTAGKTAEARESLPKFLASRAPRNLTLRAVDMLRDPETENQVAAALKAAAALPDAQAAEARKKILEVVEKFPLSKAAMTATLKTKVCTQPEGAVLMLNGRVCGPAPLTLDLPATGLVDLVATKEGFKPEQVLRCNVRDESLSLCLERKPVALRQLPFPASAGLAAKGDTVLLASNEEVCFSSIDLKSLNRIKLPAFSGKAEAAQYLAPAYSDGQGFCTRAGDKSVFSINREGAVQTMRTTGLPLSALISFESAQPPAKLVGLATTGGFEVFRCDTEQAHRAFKLTDTPPPLGIAFDGDTAFLPRSAGVLQAVTVATCARKWQGKIDGEISGPPACIAKNVVAVANAKGTLVAFESGTGKEKWRQELGAEAPFGVAAVPSAFVVGLKGGKIQAHAADGGKIAWTAQLAGEMALPAAVVSGAKPALAVCMREDSRYTLSLLDGESGKVLWSSGLSAAPVALGVDGERLYVSSADSVVAVFDCK